MIRQASSVLYSATRKRAYFKDVRILVPETWINIPSNGSTWETFSVGYLVLVLLLVYLNFTLRHNKLANVRVAPAIYNVPYTLQSGGCGQPGEYIHFTPDYILNMSQSKYIENYGLSGTYKSSLRVTTMYFDFD